MMADLEGIEIIHRFNILRASSSLSQIKWFKENNKKVILTPIYWNMSEFLAYYSPERLKFWNYEQKKRQEILNMVDYLAPNGKSELLMMQRDFNFNLDYNYIYNGVEKFFESDNDYEKRKYILAVGRIHPRKNQLRMIRAVKELKLPVFFIGKINDRNYFRRCEKEAKGSMIKFFNEVPREDLKNYYKNCRVHMMVSWYDTPGLVNLEAGLAGSNLVLTDRGTTKDYFKDLAFYSSPLNIDLIKEKVKKAYYKDPENKIKKLILENYTWDKIAIELKELYKEI